MKCDNCKKQNGDRCRCKLCKRMICNDCWGKGHNSDYCLRCEGEYNRINPLKVESTTQVKNATNVSSSTRTIERAKRIGARSAATYLEKYKKHKPQGDSDGTGTRSESD